MSCINGETKIIDGTDLAMVYQGNPRFVLKIFLSQMLTVWSIYLHLPSILMVNDR